MHIFNREVDVFGCRCKDEALLHFTPTELANIYIVCYYIPMLHQKSLLLQVKKMALCASGLRTTSKPEAAQGTQLIGKRAPK